MFTLIRIHYYNYAFCAHKNLLTLYCITLHCNIIHYITLYYIIDLHEGHMQSNACKINKILCKIQNTTAVWCPQCLFVHVFV